MRIVISGANGFVGKAVTALAVEQGHQAVALVRRPGGGDRRAQECVIGDDNFAGIAAQAGERLGACDAFVHLAARVHVMRDQAADPLAEFRAVNVDGALNAAMAALRAGARRFVFVSSIKALGEGEPGRPWREDDPPAPADPYGVSKHEAEVALQAFGREHGIEVVVVRPPLVYGAGVGANFLALMRAVDKGIPLPLGAVAARRSLVHVDNLADALLHCATAQPAAGECFHVADEAPPTVPALLRMIGAALGRPARLFPVPVAALRLAGALTGKRAAIERLTDSLRLDTGHIGATLGWRAPRTTEQGLEATALWYRSRHTRRQ